MFCDEHQQLSAVTLLLLDQKTHQESKLIEQMCSHSKRLLFTLCENEFELLGIMIFRFVTYEFTLLMSLNMRRCSVSAQAQGERAASSSPAAGEGVLLVSGPDVAAVTVPAHCGQAAN